MALVFVIGVLLFPSQAYAYPERWLTQAECIRSHESGSRWRLRNAPYAGAYEFMVSTWRRFAPRSFPRDPASASPAQQTLVAWRIYVANGRRWGVGRIGAQWPNTARLCGVE